MCCLEILYVLNSDCILVFVNVRDDVHGTMNSAIDLEEDDLVISADFSLGYLHYSRKNTQSMKFY